MEFQNSVQKIQSIVIQQSVIPYSCLQQKPQHQIYRGQFIIPFSTFSIKFTFVLVKINFKTTIYVQISILLMVSPPNVQLDFDGNEIMLQKQNQSIPISLYSYNYIYCERSNLGINCSNHVPPSKNQ